MASFTRAGDEDDAAFLSAVAEVESVGLRRLSHGDSKRQHVEPAESVSSSLQNSHGAGYGDFGYGDSDRDKEAASKRSRIEPEGEYMAALRGNHSETWQAMSSKGRLDAKPRYGAASSYSRSTNRGFDGGGALGGSSDVWPSKANMTPSSWGSDSSDIPGQAQVPQKNCPCGGGACLVLTANTEKNPGRQFYRCPLGKEEGQCGFFEWCDGMTNSSQGLNKAQGSSNADAEFPCPCGAGPCVKLTAKTEKNMGRQFYRCPLNQGEGSCNFFKWCDECVPTSGATAPAFGGSAFRERTSMSNVASGQCLKCGMDGHWAKDCSFAAQNASPNKGYTSTMRTGQEEGRCGFREWGDGMTNSSKGLNKEQGSSYADAEFPCPCGTGPCVKLTAKTEKNMGRQFYRCPLNQGEGSCNFFKWCDECVPASGATLPASGGSAFRERTSMVNVAPGQCLKCGMDGHWAKDCPSALQNTSPDKGYASTMRTGQLGSGTAAICFKCNQPGHYANNCPNQQSSYGSKGAVGGFNRQGGENSFSRGYPNASGYGSSGTGRDVGGVKGNVCYKCGSDDHWANKCPNGSNTMHSSYGGGGSYGPAKSGGSGSCYKCGGQGHYANDCRADGKGGRNMF